MSNDGWKKRRSKGSTKTHRIPTSASVMSLVHLFASPWVSELRLLQNAWKKCLCPIIVLIIQPLTIEWIAMLSLSSTNVCQIEIENKRKNKRENVLSHIEARSNVYDQNLWTNRIFRTLTELVETKVLWTKLRIYETNKNEFIASIINRIVSFSSP